MTDFGNYERIPKGISANEWNSLTALLPISDKVLNDYEKDTFVKTLKQILTAGDYERITLYVLQAFISLHLKGGEINASL